MVLTTNDLGHTCMYFEPKRNKMVRIILINARAIVSKKRWFLSYLHEHLTTLKLKASLLKKFTDDWLLK